MKKFKIKSLKNNKINFINDNYDLTNNKFIMESHTEIFSNKMVIIEECKSIVDYKDDYIKLKLKKGYVNFLGTEFKITFFEQQKIIIYGNISSVEFCV